MSKIKKLKLIHFTQTIKPCSFDTSEKLTHGWLSYRLWFVYCGWPLPSFVFLNALIRNSTQDVQCIQSVLLQAITTDTLLPFTLYFCQ